MQYKKTGNHWLIVLEKGEKIIECLTRFIKRNSIKAGYFSAIGAVSQVELAHYDSGRKRYHTKLLSQPLEIVSLTGNAAYKTKEIIIHSHIAVSTEKMLVYGGHLKEATVAVTCEIVLKELHTSITRRYDKNTGLNLINLD